MGGGAMDIDLPKPLTKPKTSSNNLTATRQLSSPYGTCRDEAVTQSGSFPHSAFGPVPSKSEVDIAISVLQNFINAVSSTNGSESNSKWVVQLLEGPTSRLVVSYGLSRLCEAFQSFQLDPSIKKLVVTLASDKAVWEAIMNNELVRKLGEEPPSSAESERQKNSSDELDLATRIGLWIWKIAKAKVIEIVEKIQSLVAETFHDGSIRKKCPFEDDDEMELNDKVRSSLLLSVVILLIVVVARASRV